MLFFFSQDLEQLFDTDSENEDDGGNAKSAKASKSGVGGAGGSGECSSSELANIYPTPPSADHNKDDPDPEVTGEHHLDTMHGEFDMLMREEELVESVLDSMNSSLVILGKYNS